MFGRSRRQKRSLRVAFSVEPQGVALAATRHADTPLPIEVCAQRDLVSPDDLPEVLAALAEETGVAGAEAIAVLHPALYEMRLVDAPDVPAEEMPAAIRWLVRDLVDFSPERASVDYIEIPEIAGKRRHARIHLVAAPGELTESVVDASERAGLRLAQIDIGELALRNLASHYPEDLHGLAVVRLVPQGGRITVTRCGQLYLSRRIEVGLSQLARGGTAPAAAGGAELHVEWMEALLLEIQRSLDYYESRFEQPPVTDLLFAPLEEPVPELLPFMEKHLGAAVRAMELGAKLDLPDGVDDSMLSRLLLPIGALMGLGSIDE